MDKRSTPGFGNKNTAVKTMLGMKNKCCVNIKVYFEIVCVYVRILIRPYPPFPFTCIHLYGTTTAMHSKQLYIRR